VAASVLKTSAAGSPKAVESLEDDGGLAFDFPWARLGYTANFVDLMGSIPGGQGVHFPVGVAVTTALFLGMDDDGNVGRSPGGAAGSGNANDCDNNKPSGVEDEEKLGTIGSMDGGAIGNVEVGISGGIPGGCCCCEFVDFTPCICMVGVAVVLAGE